MDFKFNFLPGDELNSNKAVYQDDTIKDEALAAAEVCVDKEKHRKVELEQKLTETWEIGSMNFTLVSSASLEKDLKEADTSSIIKCAIQQQSDLLPGKYEGGLKVWEGAIDLCNYIASINLDFKNKKVFELGCGAGIPGIYALKNGAVVHFQDFNEEVLTLLTIPNVLLNTSCGESCPSITRTHYKFLSGDWKSIQMLCELEWQQESNKFDVVLTSETIYNPANHNHLYQLIKASLKHTGTAYVAAKSYYFGIGGGIEEFKNLVKADQEMEIQTCWCHSEGIKREILRLQRKLS